MRSHFDIQCNTHLRITIVLGSAYSHPHTHPLNPQMAAAGRAVAARVAGGEGGRRRGWPAARAEAAIREVASGDTKAVVPGPMVTLVMITKSLGSAISVEQFVLLAPAAGKREAFAREVEGRWIGRKASNAVPANA